jgi:hypothetical protein
MAFGRDLPVTQTPHLYCSSKLPHNTLCTPVADIYHLFYPAMASHLLENSYLSFKTHLEHFSLSLSLSLSPLSLCLQYWI